jgi:hypothetical protein
MATLTQNEKAKVRQFMQAKANIENVPITWDKDEVDTASQAFENSFAADKPDLAAAIENAAPGVFNGTQKKWIGAIVLYINYVKDIV